MRGSGEPARVLWPNGSRAQGSLRKALPSPYRPDGGSLRRRPGRQSRYPARSRPPSHGPGPTPTLYSCRQVAPRHSRLPRRARPPRPSPHRWSNPSASRWGSEPQLWSSWPSVPSLFRGLRAPAPQHPPLPSRAQASSHPLARQRRSSYPKQPKCSLLRPRPVLGPRPVGRRRPLPRLRRTWLGPPLSSRRASVHPLRPLPHRATHSDPTSSDP